MKRISILAIIVCAIFAFFAVNSFAADEAALKVTALNGKASVKIYPSKTWTDLSIGQTAHSKDVIKTEPGAAITLELSDKSSVSLKPDTEIIIDELVLDNVARKLKVSMSKGDLRMIITKASTPSDFSVKTPNAVYSAAGTVFYVNVTPTGTSVYVADGSINVVNPVTGAVYSVVAGMIMTFNPDGTVVGPAPASDVDVSNWTAFYTPTTEPYTPPLANNNDVNPPDNTPERPVSGA